MMPRSKKRRHVTSLPMRRKFEKETRCFFSYTLDEILQIGSIRNFRCPPEFAILFREFGGNVSIRDGSGQLATDISTPGNEDDNTRATARLLRLFQGISISGTTKNFHPCFFQPVKKPTRTGERSQEFEQWNDVCSTNYDAAFLLCRQILCPGFFHSLQTRQEKWRLWHGSGKQSGLKTRTNPISRISPFPPDGPSHKVSCNPANSNPHKI